MQNKQRKLASSHGYRTNKEGNVVIYEHYLNALGLITLLMLSIVFGIWVTINFPWAVQYLALGKMGAVEFNLPLPLFLFISLALLALVLRAIRNTKLVFCPDYLIYITGALSWKEKTIRGDGHFLHLLRIIYLAKKTVRLLCF